MTKGVFDLARERVRDGDLGGALEILQSAAEGINADHPSSRMASLKRELILQQGSWTQIAKAARLGSIDSREERQERIRLGAVVLSLSDELERVAPRSLIQEPKVTFDPRDQFNLEQLISGQKTLKGVGWYKRALDCSRSVCRVVGPRGNATGFLVSKDLIITNNHVIGSSAEAKLARMEFNFEEREDGSVCPISVYRTTSDVFMTSVDLDCSVVSVEGNNGATSIREWGKLDLGPVAPVTKGDHVTIIQHPFGGVKQISATMNQVVNIFEHRLHYTTDTLPGSSGSPVFDDNWRVVAIHHAGGHVKANKWGGRIFANEGILISSILENEELRRVILS